MRILDKLTQPENVLLGISLIPLGISIDSKEMHPSKTLPSE
jgi:hypothetical protein